MSVAEAAVTDLHATAVEIENLRAAVGRTAHHSADCLETLERESLEKLAEELDKVFYQFFFIGGSIIKLFGALMEISFTITRNEDVQHLILMWCLLIFLF